MTRRQHDQTIPQPCFCLLSEDKDDPMKQEGFNYSVRSTTAEAETRPSLEYHRSPRVHSNHCTSTVQLEVCTSVQTPHRDLWLLSQNMNHDTDIFLSLWWRLGEVHYCPTAVLDRNNHRFTWLKVTMLTCDQRGRSFRPSDRRCRSSAAPTFLGPESWGQQKTCQMICRRRKLNFIKQEKDVEPLDVGKELLLGPITVCLHAVTSTSGSSAQQWTCVSPALNWSVTPEPVQPLSVFVSPRLCWMDSPTEARTQRGAGCEKCPVSSSHDTLGSTEDGTGDMDNGVSVAVVCLCVEMKHTSAVCAVPPHICSTSVTMSWPLLLLSSLTELTLLNGNKSCPQNVSLQGEGGFI